MRCWFGHQWSKWEFYERLMSYVISPQQQYKCHWQRRKCERCGYTQEKEVDRY